MRSAAPLLLFLLPLGAQIATQIEPPPGQPVVDTSKKISLRTFYGLERACDDKLRSIGEPNTMDLLGATRGVYLEGYGAVLTAEISLATAPALYPFHPVITPQEKIAVHQKMVERLPLLRSAVKDMVRNAAITLGTIPENQQIVVAVRLDYRQWEDTSGLPGLVLMKADRKSALAGIVQIEEQ